MGSWLSRLFGSSGRAPEESISATASVDAYAENPVRAGKIIWQPQVDINDLFFKWLAGYDAAAAPAPQHVEQSILSALERVAQSELGGADLVPRVPTVIPHLLQSLRNENISGAALSREIAHDIILVAEVIRQANSTYYHSGDPITSLENAVTVLGKNGLRLLIAKVAFRPIINIQSGHFTKVAAPRLWEQSEKCAMACRLLAHEVHADPFPAFLAGLMQNVGMIVAFRLIDQVCDGKTLPVSAAFWQAYARYAHTFSYRIARLWDFPEVVLSAIEELAKVHAAQDRSVLGNLLYMSDQLSKMAVLVHHRQLQENDERLTVGLSAGGLRCYQEINASEEH